MIGTRLGAYEVVGELGRGGMGAVYRARHTELGHEVALKVVRTADARLAARFEREAQAAARLADHPGIVGVHDAGRTGEVSWLAMELVPGDALDAVITQRELTPQTAARILAGAARAVHHANTAGVIHRDLKPGNILVQPDGTPRVTDFGLALPAAAGPEVQRLTASDEVLGTPAYMPPEQALGDAADARSDVWSLGATLYHAVAGAPPFDRPGLLETLTAVISEDPPPAPPGVPRDLQRVIDTCLTRDRAARYPTALALAEDLERFGAGEPVLARPAARLRRRARAVLALSGGVLALAAAAGGAWWWARAEAHRAQDSAQGAAARSEAELRRDDIKAAWFRLTGEPAADLRLAEDHWNGVPVEPARLRAAVERTTATCRALERDHPAARSPAAWLALVRALAGDPEGPRAVEAALAQAGDDPLARVLIARWFLARYMTKLSLPEVLYHPNELRFPKIEEPAELAALRERLAAAVEPIGKPLQALRLTSGDAVASYVAAAGDYAADRHAEAARHAAEAAADPLLEVEAGVLRGLALYHRRDYQGAARAFRPAAGRGWHLALTGRAQALNAHAMNRASQRRGAPQDFQDAIAAYELALQAMPDQSHIRVGLAACHWGLGGLTQNSGGDPVPHYTRCITLLDAIVAAEPHRRDALSNRATAYMTLARARAARGVDPLPDYRRAVQDVAAAIQAGAPLGELQILHGSLWMEMARLPGSPPHLVAARCRQALAAFEATILQFPKAMRPRRERAAAAMLLATRGGLAGRAAIDLLATALADVEFCLERAPEQAATAVQRAVIRDLHHNRGAILQMLAFQDRSDPAAAEARVTESLREFDGVLAEAPDRVDTWQAKAQSLAHRAELAGKLGRDPRPDHRATIAALGEVLARRPKHFAAAYNRGAVARLLAQAEGARGGDPAPHCRDAVAFFTAAIALQPKHAMAHALRGLMHRRLGDLDAAIADLARAKQLDPKATHIHNWFVRTRNAARDAAQKK